MLEKTLTQEIEAKKAAIQAKADAEKKALDAELAVAEGLEKLAKGNDYASVDSMLKPLGFKKEQKSRTTRTDGEVEIILKDAEDTSVAKAAKKHKVAGSQIYTWRSKKKKLGGG